MHLKIPPQINQEELHIWWANLREFDLAVPALWAVLSPWEQAQAEQCPSPRAKENYIIRRGMLRMLLASYIGQSPSGLNFTNGPHGKPELQTRPDGNGVYFNLSHSADVAVYGFTGACPIGVDVECLHPVPHYEQLARDFFSPSEVEGLMSLPAEFRVKRFLDLWTRMEALSKAVGDGLDDGPKADLRTPAWSETSGLAESSEGLNDFTGWFVRSFSPVPGYVASVAFRNPHLDVICRGTPGFFSGDLCPARLAIPQN